MGFVSLVGNDTIKVNNELYTDFPHGDVAKLTFPNEMVTVKTGKDGNVIYAFNASGKQAALELRVLRGSKADKDLNSQMALYQGDPPNYTLLTAELSKRIGDGAGGVRTDTYILTGGVISKQVEATSNVEGEVEQAVSVYTMQFATAPRTIS